MTFCENTQPDLKIRTLRRTWINFWEKRSWLGETKPVFQFGQVRQSENYQSEKHVTTIL